MKNIRSLLYISIFVLLASCASSRTAIRVEPEPVPLAPEPVPLAPEPVPLAPEPVPLAPEPVPLAPEPVPLAPEPVPLASELVPLAPVEEPLPIDLAVRRVKQNQPDIHKYFALDEAADIIVMAKLTEQSEDFLVVYDLVNAIPTADGSGFTVSFSISGKQSGETRDDTLEWLIREDKTGLLIALDDDYQDVWTEYLDLFDQYGAKITFFVQGRLDPFCALALSRGHDVGYHSINHLNLPKVSREVFFEETTSDLSTFRDAGIPLNSFAYPYGLSEPWMHEELLHHFKILRGYGVTFRVYDTATIQRGYISSKAIDNILYKQDAAFESIITLMLRTIKFIGGDLVLPLTTHTITDDADWGIKPARLEYLLRMASQLQLKFYRYCDFESL